jgi:hypothetical protein
MGFIERRNKVRRTYRMPNGKLARSRKIYGESWEALYKPIEKEFGAFCRGFDPDLLLVDSDGFSWSIPVRIAIHIVELIGRKPE